MPERLPTQLSWRSTLSNSKCQNAQWPQYKQAWHGHTLCCLQGLVWMLREAVNRVSLLA